MKQTVSVLDDDRQLSVQEHGSSLALSIAALMAELAKTQKERAEGERYRRAHAVPAMYRCNCSFDI